jgi:penicillin-binding protein 2
LTAAVRAKSMMRISDRLTRSQAFLILQDGIHLPGISLTIEEQRYYPKEKLASHILGYVGQITDEELDQFSDQGYHSGDWIGKSGLERLYDPALHGQDGGFLIEVDARGRQVRVIRHLLPQAGKDLVLTLDEKVEALAEQRLHETGHPGAAVVLNPQTGELIALASSPGFDPNLFLPLGNSDERKALLADPETPLYNRAIQALYPPGSTFKIITSLAALDAHAIDPDKRVFCSGSYTMGKDRRVFRCWKKEGHGYVNFMEAIAQSCDVYYYQLGLAVGPDAIEAVAKAFGLGQVTGVDLPHEKKWALPIAFKKRMKEYWYSGDTLNYAIGQGLLQVTPLQMANMIAAIANGGTLWQPFLVTESRRFGEPSEHLGGPRLGSRLTLNPESLRLVRAGLLRVVNSGTGIASKIPGIEVAGKTGTAQVSKGKDQAWFVAYAPADIPRVACAVVVEHGGHGGSVSAPIAHDLIALALGDTAVAKEHPRGASESQSD